MEEQDQFGSIFAVVRAIPPGKVMSYGQVGAEAGGISARTVGWAMASAAESDIPWQRVVGADGYLRIGRRSPELQALQRSLLQEEGISFARENWVSMVEHQISSDVIAERMVSAAP